MFRWALLCLVVGCSIGTGESDGGGGVEQISVCGFNIQVFGQSKMDKDGVPETLVRIIRAFDVVFIQEIRDAAMTSPGELLNLVNVRRPDDDLYALLLSPRYGSTSSKEAYAFMYRKAVLTPVSHEVVAGDFPERPGYSVVWSATSSSSSSSSSSDAAYTFRVVGAHIDPDNVVHELDQLGLAAAAYAAGNNSASAPVLVLGDFNADCSYLGVTAWECIRSDTCTDTVMSLWDGDTFGAENWLLGDEADTTVAASSCAYDRIVASSALLPRVVTGSAQVHKFDALFEMTNDEAKEVSDHYPISVNIDIRSDAAVATDGALSYTPPAFEGAAAQDVPTELYPGDAVIIGVHADDVDSFTVLLLVDVAKGTELHITDDGLAACDGDGGPSWRDGEGVVSWKADKGYVAGTVLQYPSGQAEPGVDSSSTAAGSNTWTKAGVFSLSASGEPLYVFQGSKTTPRWVHVASGGSSASAWDDGTSTTNGCLPTELANLPQHHFLLGMHRDNFYYNGSRDGDAAALLLLVADPANWDSSNTPIDASAYLASFQVVASQQSTAPTAPTPEPATQKPASQNATASDLTTVPSIDDQCTGTAEGACNAANTDSAVVVFVSAGSGDLASEYSGLSGDETGEAEAEAEAEAEESEWLSGSFGSGDFLTSSCRCTCKAGFGGDACTQCDTFYDGYPDCAQVDAEVAKNLLQTTTVVLMIEGDFGTIISSPDKEASFKEAVMVYYESEGVPRILILAIILTEGSVLIETVFKAGAATEAGVSVVDLMQAKMGNGDGAASIDVVLVVDGEAYTAAVASVTVRVAVENDPPARQEPGPAPDNWFTGATKIAILVVAGAVWLALMIAMFYSCSCSCSSTADGFTQTSGGFAQTAGGSGDAKGIKRGPVPDIDYDGSPANIAAYDDTEDSTSFTAGFSSSGAGGSMGAAYSDFSPTPAPAQSESNHYYPSSSNNAGYQGYDHGERGWGGEGGGRGYSDW